MGGSSAHTTFVFENPPFNPLACFLVQAFITLIITRACGKLVSYAKSPRVIGEIIGGIILGPSVLGNIPEFTEKIFPQKGPTQPHNTLLSLDTFGVIANMGLIFFMFLMGLELEAKEMTQLWKKSMPVAVASIAFPFGLGAALSQWWKHINDENNGPDWKSPHETAFILFMGVSLSFTAFPVLCAILKAKGLARTQLGAMAISCAAIDDIMAWCMLAIASSFSKSGSAADGGWTCLFAAAFVVVSLAVVKPCVGFVYRIFRTHGDAADSSLFSAMMFLLLILEAFTAEVIGIHAFFGAFIAGVIVPRDNELPAKLAPKIELPVREFLLPLFFANSGIRTDIGSIDSGYYWGITIAIIFFACVGKILPGMLMTRVMTGESWRFCGTIGVLMNTRGLVELIALNVALKFGILSPRFFTMMVIMALVTTAMTSPIIEFTWMRYLAKKNVKLESITLNENFLTLSMDDNPQAHELNEELNEDLTGFDMGMNRSTSRALRRDSSVPQSDLPSTSPVAFSTV